MAQQRQTARAAAGSRPRVREEGRGEEGGESAGGIKKRLAI